MSDLQSLSNDRAPLDYLCHVVKSVQSQRIVLWIFYAHYLILEVLIKEDILVVLI